jgi:hypothetical protein
MVVTADLLPHQVRRGVWWLVLASVPPVDCLSKPRAASNGHIVSATRARGPGVPDGVGRVVHERYLHVKAWGHGVKRSQA